MLVKALLVILSIGLVSADIPIYATSRASAYSERVVDKCVAWNYDCYIKLAYYALYTNNAGFFSYAIDMPDEYPELGDVPKLNIDGLITAFAYNTTTKMFSYYDPPIVQCRDTVRCYDTFKSIKNGKISPLYNKHRVGFVSAVVPY